MQEQIINFDEIKMFNFYDMQFINFSFNFFFSWIFKFFFKVLLVYLVFGLTACEILVTHQG